jgi:hypothetical protein
MNCCLALRRQARIAHEAGEFDSWAEQQGVTHCRAERHFGASWAAFLARRTDLSALPLHPADLPGEIAKLERLLSYAGAHP